MELIEHFKFKENIFFNITMAIKILIQRNIPPCLLNSSYMLHIYETNKHRVIINDYHWFNVNCNKPLIFAIDPYTDEYYLIDGWHRLKKAVFLYKTQGIPISLKGHYLSKYDSFRIMVITQNKNKENIIDSYEENVI